MSFFSAGLDLTGTLYIQADTVDEAEVELEKVLFRTMDANDPMWFFDHSGSSAHRPKISFGMIMTVDGISDGEEFVPVSLDELRPIMDSALAGRKAVVLPKSLEADSSAQPTYWVRLYLSSVGIISADCEFEAEDLLKEMQFSEVDLNCKEEWFKTSALVNGVSDLILSPNISITGIQHGGKLRLKAV